MVRLIIILISAIFSLINSSQENIDEKGVELNISFNKDTVFLEDSCRLNLSFENNTDSCFYFYPKSIIGMSHYHPESFITHDSARKILYWINHTCLYDSIVKLNPEEKYRYSFDIMGDSNFFYLGENNIKVFYKLYDKSANKKNWKQIRSKTSFFLWSSAIKLYVK